MLKVVTFGCRLNAYESELIKQSAESNNIQNTVIFNSCAVTNEAERQLRQAIRKAKRDEPGVRVIVTGCAAQISPHKYAAMDEVDQVLGNEEKLKPAAYSNLFIDEKVIVNDIMSVNETAPQLIDGMDGYNRAFIQVQNGCDHRCTYCQIPFGRGNNRSVPIGEIVNQTKRLVDNGYSEVVITGVDITDYGLDLPSKPRLGQMIRRLLTHVPQLNRLRLSSIDVAEIDDELMELIKYEKRLMPHLHLSLQSGDDLILKRMKRRHNRTQVLKFCDDIRSVRNITIGADIITGFPTETDEMFQNTLDLIHSANIMYLHVFPYSAHANTPAAKMPQVAHSIRRDRAKVLRQLGDTLQSAHVANQIGKQISVLFEENGVGRAEDYSLVKSNHNYKGQIINATVIDVDDKYLIV